MQWNIDKYLISAYVSLENIYIPCLIYNSVASNSIFSPETLGRLGDGSVASIYLFF